MNISCGTDIIEVERIKLDIENIGLTVTKVGSTLLNLSLKNFHDTTLHLKRINFADYID